MRRRGGASWSATCHLLELDYAERAEDAFTLFNLGWTLLDLGRTS